MIKLKLDKETGIAIVTPSPPLRKEDFLSLAESIDPYIAQQGMLNGLIIHVESFPGWEDFGALVSHLKFVRDHHRKIQKVAAVSDSKFLAIMPRIGDHFVNAEVRYFHYQNLDEAITWVKS